MPITVITWIAFRSKATAASLVSVEKSDRARWTRLIGKRSSLDQTIRSRRYSNQSSRTSTPMRYQR